MPFPLVRVRHLFGAVIVLALLSLASSAFAQGVTTGRITGVVLDAQKAPVEGASVVAIHLPSGTPYETVTREDGRFIIPNMRVGGPRPHSSLRKNLALIILLVADICRH